MIIILRKMFEQWQKQGAAEGITVLGGIEVQTVEDVHVLTFFRHPDALNIWQEEVYSALPEVENDEARFGGNN